MVKRRALLASVAAIGVSASLNEAFAANTLQEIKSKGVLNVGVKADYPPFGFRSSNGAIVGIEPDLARDLAKRLGVKVHLVPVLGSNRMQFLNQGRIDVIIATMDVTPARQKLLDMVKPYYYASGYNIMVPKKMHITSWKEVEGKPMCGVQAAFYNKNAEENLHVHIIAFTGAAEALAAVKEGRCIGLLWDNTFIQSELKKAEWKGYDMPLKTQDEQPWAIGVRTGDTQLAAFISKAIKDWDKTGFILQLETKYGMSQHSDFVEAQHKKYE